MGIEEVLGVDVYVEIFYKVGYKFVWYWCEKEVECYGLEGVVVFEYYMKCLFQCGWGLFEIEWINFEEGIVEVCLWYFVFVYVYGKVNCKVDYMFIGWFVGVMDQIFVVCGSSLCIVVEQVYSGVEDGYEDGLFVVKFL